MVTLPRSLPPNHMAFSAAKCLSSQLCRNAPPPAHGPNPAAADQLHLPQAGSPMWPA